MKIVLSLLLCFLTAASAAEEYRTFTSADQSFVVRAMLVNVEFNRLNEIVVVLKREDNGRQVRVHLSKLSDADRKYVAGLEPELTVPVAMRGRATILSRSTEREKSHSNPGSEAAVTTALTWLSAHQNKDGSWGVHQASMTGLALLALTGHGHGPASPQHGAAVKRGTEWLMDLGRKHQPPFAGVLSTAPSLIISTYEHAIATQALAEVFAFSRRGKDAPPGLREVTEKAASIIIKSQAPGGAWGYKDGIGYDPFNGNDLSVTGWQMQALRSCELAGITPERLGPAKKKAATYLMQKQTADGGLGNADQTQHYNQWNLTGSALAGLQASGDSSTGSTAVSRQAVRWKMSALHGQRLSWDKDCYLYSWYFDSLALHSAGGEEWQKWSAACEPVVLANQLPDGSWKVEKPGEVAAAGSGAGGADKDIYRVCLATLILETPWRFKVEARGK